MAGRISLDIEHDQSTSDDLSEQRAFLYDASKHPDSYWVPKSRISAFTKISAIVNLMLGIVLAMSLAFIARSETTRCQAGVQSHFQGEAQVQADVQSQHRVMDPYSPALEAIVPVIRRFKPELIYQSETSPQVEAAWKKTLGVSDGLVAIGPEESAKLAQTNHESTESVWEPGKHIYGISMYHQLHCLNTIRKSFYREKFFPELTDERFQFHKNHCFDFLRQAIMCHGDVSMTYWWNKNYTTSLSSGQEVHSDWFNNLSIDDRATNSSVYWDIEHSCRMFEPIEDWVNRHAILPNGVSFPDQD